MNNQPIIKRAAFGDGVSWLTDGANLLARGGASLSRVAVVFLLISLIQIVPMIGPLLLLLISPALSAGLINAFRAVQQSETPRPDHLLAGLVNSETRGRLIGLGVFFLLGSFGSVMILVGWLSAQMDIAALLEYLGNPEAMERNPEQLFAMFQGVSMIPGMLLSAVVFALVLAALYFAVPLVFFWRWPAVAALLFSLRAVLVNWAAFVAFGLVLFGVLVLIGLMFGLVSGLLGLALGGAGNFLAQLLMIMVSLFVQFLAAAAQWRAFFQVFPAGPETDDRGDGQDQPERFEP